MTFYQLEFKFFLRFAQSRWILSGWINPCQPWMQISFKNVDFLQGFSRNRAKKNSLETTNQVFLLLKTTFDCASKVLMFSTFMYVVNKGQFSSMMTLIAFYANLALLIIFNIIVNNNTDYKSAKTWIGKRHRQSNTVF